MLIIREVGMNSQKVDARTLCDAPDAIDGSESGLPALHYIRRVSLKTKTLINSPLSAG